MAPDESVTEWIGRLKAGHDDAAQKIWERYLGRLIGVARRKLGDAQRRGTDEDDVVALAFEQFWRGIERGRFPRLDDREDLWRILVHLTDRRAADAVRRFRTRARFEVGESALDGLEAESGPGGMNGVLDREPTPEFAAEMIENLECFLERLEDETLREIAVCRMQGFTNREIAEKLGCVERTVERKLRMIRRRLGEIEFATTKDTKAKKVRAE